MLLGFRDVAFGFTDASLLLRGVNFEVRRSDRIAVIGANGTGKSTLLRLAAGLLKPTAGSVTYSGEHAPAFLFQNPRQQLVCSTVREELEYTLRIQGTERREAAALAARYLETFGLVRLSDVHPKTLSGGQQQKLAVAALLTRQPELLLLDEPEAFMDGASRQIFRDFVSEQAQTAAVLWTCCRMSEVPESYHPYRLRNGELRPWES